MRTTLVSILGRTPKDANGYRKTPYTFPDGESTEPLAFFGWAVQKREQPDRLVILGTSGSMWDHLFEGDVDFEQEHPEERLALMEAAEAKGVTQEQLDRLAPKLSARIGCDTQLVIIPYAVVEAEQLEILRTAADLVEEGATVHLDVTHGFRHLPMLILLAALYMRIVRKAQIGHIWYAAYDPDMQKAPVLDLSGLLRIADGIQALSSFDKDGDYGVFLPLLARWGLPENALEALGKAVYYENILNVGEATGQLRRFQEVLQERSVVDPEAEFLLPAIKERLAWFENGKQFEKIQRLAQQSLQRKDYLRALLYAYEAVITKLCQRCNVPVQSFEDRESVRDDYENWLRQHPQEQASYKLLKNLRNQVAHGTRGSTAEVQQSLLQPEKMQHQMERLLQQIQNGELPGPGFQRSTANPAVNP